jgi:xanthine dehydrogenase large subunit
LVCAQALGIAPDLVNLEPTRTSTVANTMPTAASNDTDLNAMAALLACQAIRQRLDAVAAGLPPGVAWTALVAAAHAARVDLSAHGFYATPGLFYDLEREQGCPFAYHVHGCAVVEATVDTIRGTYTLDKATIVHDAGSSIDPLIDRGQIEGALAQGLGWALLEDLRYGPDGRLLSDTLSTYKVPDIHFMPQMDIDLLSDVPNPLAVANSKGIGEPPFMYGIAGYFAVLDALKAARPDQPLCFDLPLTTEKILLFLEGALTPKVLPW